MAGNSNSGRKNDRPISDAIRMALEREIKDPKQKGKMTKQSTILANKIVALAKKGDKWAMEQCMDRIEGKPAQTVDNTIHYNPMEDLFGDILAATQARAVPRASETSH